MNKHKTWVIFLVIVFFTGSYILYQIFYQKTDIISEKVDFTVKANELYHEFETAEQTATIKYSNKIIEVKGRVDEIIKAPENKLIILLKDTAEMFGINCSMQLNKNKIVKPQAGDSVTIKGILQGYLDDVILNDCIILNYK